MSELISITTQSPAETMLLGELIGRSLGPGDVVALEGELGAGKTVLTKGIARGLGVQEEPSSPTFVIMQEYEGRCALYHYDLYRLAGARDLEGIGYEDFFYGGGVCVVEWADKAAGLLPAGTVYVHIDLPGTDGAGIINKRLIEITGDSKWLSSFRSTAERAFPT